MLPQDAIASVETEFANYPILNICSLGKILPLIWQVDGYVKVRQLHWLIVHMERKETGIHHQLSEEKKKPLPHLDTDLSLRTAS